MRRLLKFISFILVLCTITSLFVACKKDEEDPDEDENEDFTGSISGDGNTESPDENPDNTPPIGEGEKDKVYEIRTPDDLKSINQNGKYILMNDIDLSGIDFSPIGTYGYPFRGEFDGQGFSIKNLKISTSEEDIGNSLTFKYVYAGLFGVTDSANIHNIKFENADISSDSTTEYCFVLSGIIAGYMQNTTVSNCEISGKVTAKSKYFCSYAAGVAAFARESSVRDVSLSCNILSDESANRAYAGGTVAFVTDSSSIVKCFTSGTVKSVSTYGNSYSGGIAGMIRNSELTACRNNADVIAEVSSYSDKSGNVGAAYAGGVTAVAGADILEYSSKISRCYSTSASVTANGNGNSVYAAGIAAKVDMAEFTHCYSLSAVKAETKGNKSAFSASAFAYLTGQDYKVNGCFATGNAEIIADMNTRVNIGTFCAYPKSNDDAVNFTNNIYSASATFLVNGATATEFLAKTGTSRLASLFNLEYIVSELKWNATEWQTVDGVITAL